MFGMSSHIWCVLFVMVVLTGFGEPASILMIPCSHYSYINTFSVFGKTLISAGHEVGWVGNFYRPQTMLPEGNVFTPVCQSFCSQGRGVSQHAMGGAVHPFVPPGQTPPGRHPLGRLPGDGHWSGRYASYWNALNFRHKIEINLTHFSVYVNKLAMWCGVV